MIPVLISGLSGCVALHPLPPGTYLETRPHTALFTSRELQVYPDGRLRYWLHTDDASLGRESGGTYRWRGSRLELRLNGQPDTSTAHSTRATLPATEQQLRFYVSARADEAGRREPLPGLTVLVRDAAGSVVAGATTDSAGYAELPLGAVDAPQTLEIAGLGWRRWQHPRPAVPTVFRVQLPPRAYQAYAAGTRKTFGVLSVSPQRLVLRQGTDTLTLRRRP
ncbi:hypothetical protein [Hymenobacter sp. B81]|uniref:hypothetical protein n=1 Tax=Hymenobacter sp. B81 TaxID=3344878 RepID=UPI0037DC39B4